MNLQQGLSIKYNRRENLEKYFPNEHLGVADRSILNLIIRKLNLIIRKQKVIGVESFGDIIRSIESFGYKTQKPYKLN